MLGSISIEVIIEVLRENSHKERTWVLWRHQPLLGQGRCAEKMSKATAKRRHWIWGERNGNENW